MNLSEKKVEANRNFANKIWNAGRFVINAIENAPNKPEQEPGLDTGGFLDLRAHD
jgi:valyl-tRNA synthetase